VLAAFAPGDRVRLLEDISPGFAGDTGVVTATVPVQRITVRLDDNNMMVGPAHESRFESA
jgi:hypothetical protein